MFDSFTLSGKMEYGWAVCSKGVIAGQLPVRFGEVEDTFDEFGGHRI